MHFGIVQPQPLDGKRVPARQERGECSHSRGRVSEAVASIVLPEQQRLGALDVDTDPNPALTAVSIAISRPTQGQIWCRNDGLRIVSPPEPRATDHYHSIRGITYAGTSALCKRRVAAPRLRIHRARTPAELCRGRKARMPGQRSRRGLKRT